MKFISSIILVFLYLVFFCASCTNSPFKYLNNTEMKKVFVYKYDQSKQCEKESRISIEDMQKEFGKIKVFSAESVNDGLFRSQVCGTSTGQMNVYEISLIEFSKAENLGFKKWEKK